MPGEKRRIWVAGRTLGFLKLKAGKKYYCVDGKYGGRIPATDLEVALWNIAFGGVEEAPNVPIVSSKKPKKKAKKRNG